MKVKYNTSIEVTEKQYRKLMYDLSGVVAGREDNGKFYIKLMAQGYAKHVEKIIR